MDRDTKTMRGKRPLRLHQHRAGEGVDVVVDFIETAGGPEGAGSGRVTDMQGMTAMRAMAERAGHAADHLGARPGRPSRIPAPAPVARLRSTA
jgi:hypothetical protein